MEAIFKAVGELTDHIEFIVRTSIKLKYLLGALPQQKLFSRYSYTLTAFHSYLIFTKIIFCCCHHYFLPNDFAHFNRIRSTIFRIY